MKTIITFAAIIFFSVASAGIPPRLSQVTKEEFKVNLHRIIQSAKANQFGSIKGDTMEVITKTYSKIINWHTTDSLPGHQKSYVTKSFCTSFRSVFAESNEISEELIAQYEYINSLLHESLASTWWFIHEDINADGVKRTSASRMAKSELNIWPDINLEITKRGGKYLLLLSVSI